MFENHWSSGDCVVIQSRSSSGFKRTPKKVKHKYSYIFTFEEFSYKYSPIPHNRKIFSLENMIHEIMVVNQSSR